MYSLIIVDDEIELRNGLVNYFPWEEFGFKVENSFGSAQEAILWFKENTADVLLTDIRMPFMNGLELISKIKEIKSDSILFCLLTAHKDFQYAQKGIQLGIRHYLVKPTDFNEIGQAFREIKEELDKKQKNKITYQDIKNIHIQKALNLIQASPDSTSLKNLADRLNVNASYLSRLFKEETGQNFSTILNAAKMEKAKIFLTSHVSYSNREIAGFLGYLDPQNFCRSFRKHFKMTPQSYRKKYYNS